MTNHQSSIPKVLVTMGGSDPQGMTIKAVKALEMLEENFEAVVVLGAEFQHKEELNDLLSDCKHHFNVRENVKNMAEIMAQSDFAVASFGVTAYKLAAMGVPAIYMCLTEDHAESATSFVLANIGVSLGVHKSVSEENSALSISSLLNNPLQRLSMGTKARHLIDGRSAQKISQLIGTKLEEQR